MFLHLCRLFRETIRLNELYAEVSVVYRYQYINVLIDDIYLLKESCNNIRNVKDQL